MADPAAILSLIGHTDMRTGRTTYSLWRYRDLAKKRGPQLVGVFTSKTQAARWRTVGDVLASVGEG